MKFIVLTLSDLKHSSVNPVSPKINWARIDEADNFAKTVKLFRQGKYDEDSFRRFRLQHGAYGTRMTSDYAMVRIKFLLVKFIQNNLKKYLNLVNNIL